MNDPVTLLLLLVIGVAAGFLNVMAGGGSTIVLPVLIFMGFDSALANGTNRIAILLQNISAVTSFKRLDHFQFRESMKLSMMTLPGAIAGSLVAVQVSDAVFQKILGGVMIGVVISMFISPTGLGNQLRERKHVSKLIYPVMFAIGFYGGFIQVGVGFLFMAALYHMLRLTLVYVNMHKVFIVLVYSLPTITVFFLTGNIDWFIGVVLGLGSALGGWWAAHVSVKKGDRIIRNVLVVAIVVMALKLFNVF